MNKEQHALIRLFEQQANSLNIDSIRDWAQGPLTSMYLETDVQNAHMSAPYASPLDGSWHEH
jgi:hypothetical protein